jgi:hypothetical protein
MPARLVRQLARGIGIGIGLCVWLKPEAEHFQAAARQIAIG